MEISVDLLHFDGQMAICAVTIQDTNGRVTLYKTALASESVYYADLAQTRALVNALRVLKEGPGALLAAEVEKAMGDVFQSIQQPPALSVEAKGAEISAPVVANVTVEEPLQNPAAEKEKGATDAKVSDSIELPW
jgi:hypothetical protein